MRFRKRKSLFGCAGVEPGEKACGQPRTYLVLLVEHRWFFNRARSIDNRFRAAPFTYSAGVGFNV